MARRRGGGGGTSGAGRLRWQRGRAGIGNGIANTSARRFTAMRSLDPRRRRRGARARCRRVAHRIRHPRQRRAASGICELSGRTRCIVAARRQRARRPRLEEVKRRRVVAADYLRHDRQRRQRRGVSRGHDAAVQSTRRKVGGPNCPMQEYARLENKKTTPHATPHNAPPRLRCRRAPLEHPASIATNTNRGEPPGSGRGVAARRAAPLPESRARACSRGRASASRGCAEHQGKHGLGAVRGYNLLETE